ncbi:MAG: tetratricopeptide repeat protein [Halioglobus sp.]|nr:tetratricopeptide repeat protein [Halioglobus sp.]
MTYRPEVRRHLASGFLALALLASSALPVHAAPIRSIGDHHTDALDAQATPQTRRDIPVETRGRAGSEAFSDLHALIRAGDYPRLQALAESVLADNPDSGLAYEVLGIAHFMAQRDQAALQAFDDATRVEPEQAGPWTKKGILLLAQGDTDGALAALLTAIERDPYDRHAHQRLGILYQQRGDARRAIVHYQLGMQGTGPEYLGVALELATLLNATGRYTDTIALLEPRLPLHSAAESGATAYPAETHMALAKAYFETRQFDAALQRYQHAATAAGDSSRARLGMAASLRERGDVEQSLREIDSVLSANPKSVRGHLERGTSLFALNRPAQARRAYQQAIALGADETRVMRHLAGLYEQARDFPAAAGVYTSLVDKGLADENTFSSLAMLQLLLGDPPAARATLQRATADFPDSAFIHWRQGSLSASLGDYPRAVTELKRAYQLAPADRTVLQAYSLALSRNAQFAQSAAIAREVYELDTRSTPGGQFYALRLIEAGDTGEAENVLRAILALQPDHVPSLNNLAQLLQQRGELTAAAELAERAHASAPENAQVLDTLGWIQHLLGTHEKALDMLQRAVSLAPDLAVAHYHRARVLLALGEQAQAAAAFERALSLNGDAEWANEARAHLPESSDRQTHP